MHFWAGNAEKTDVGNEGKSSGSTSSAVPMSEYLRRHQPRMDGSSLWALANLQPVDASQKFGYSVVRVEFWIGGTRWEWTSSESEVAHGASQHPGTMLTMHPGEW